MSFDVNQPHRRYKDGVAVDNFATLVCGTKQYRIWSLKHNETSANAAAANYLVDGYERGMRLGDAVHHYETGANVYTPMYVSAVDTDKNIGNLRRCNHQRRIN